MMRLVRSITILRQRWRIKWATRLGSARVPLRGTCEVSELGGPHPKDKTIRLLLGQTELALLDTIIHECLHAALPHLDELYVERIAEDFARIVMRFGYRRVCENCSYDQGRKRIATERQ